MKNLELFSEIKEKNYKDSKHIFEFRELKCFTVKLLIKWKRNSEDLQTLLVLLI